MVWIPKELSDYRKAIITSRYENEGSVPIARDLGVPRGTVCQMARKMGLIYHNRYKDNAAKARETALKPNSGNKMRMEWNPTLNTHYFDKWTPDMAYVLGFIFADGSVSKYTLSIQISELDISVLEFVKRELQATREINHYPASKKCSTGPSASIRIHSKFLVDKLGELGVFPAKTYRNDPFPNVPTDCLGHFIRGVFDGDGSVCSGKACGVNFIGPVSFIQTMAERMHHEFSMSLKTVRITEGKRASWANVYWTKPNDLRLFYRSVYPNGFNFCLERKHNLLLQWLLKPRVEMKVTESNAETLGFPKPLSCSDKRRLRN